MVMYLSVVMDTLQPLPVSIQNYTRIKSLTVCANCLIDLLSNRIPKYNFNAVKDLNADLGVIEEYSKKFNSANLFLEVKQLLQLLLSPDFEEYFDPEIKKQKYYLLNDLNLLEKVFTR